MPADDGWDWPYLYYMGTVILHQSENEFWRGTPRKLHALAKVHTEANNPDAAQGEAPKTKKKVMYIDQVLF